jgi:hypothetical protein
MRATVPTERKAIVDLLDGLSGRIFVAFEEGTQSQWLHDVFKPHSEYDPLPGSAHREHVVSGVVE